MGAFAVRLAPALDRTGGEKKKLIRTNAFTFVRSLSSFRLLQVCVCTFNDAFLLLLLLLSRFDSRGARSLPVERVKCSGAVTGTDLFGRPVMTFGTQRAHTNTLDTSGLDERFVLGRTCA